MKTIKVRATKNGHFYFKLDHGKNYSNLGATHIRGLKNLKNFLSSRNLLPDFWGFYGSENLIEKYKQI